MKKAMRIFKLITVVYGLLSYSYGQELKSKIVNSPQALSLNSEIQSTLLTLRNERAKLTKLSKTELGNQNSEKDKVEKSIESLSKKLFLEKKKYANEILKPNDSQAVLNKMKEAVLSGQNGSAEKIKNEYRQKLLDDANRKRVDQEIDRQAFREEVKAIDKIIGAFGDIVYPPVELKSE
ncbi:hypothetical protein [Sphingobacterium siyangense]|uniref:hypothetical protein n=1 Tax=Sphingobacterium siyangense TaxID=459529 RepID=UPI003C725B85